jgi:hypothetical protein
MSDERDLTTLADVRSWLGFNATNTANDGDLARLITGCSLAMLRYMQRDIIQQTYNDTFNGTGGAVLTLRRGPVARVKSVVVNGQTLDSSAYTSDDFALYLLRGRFPRGLQNVEVAYVAGYDTVPVDLAQACIETVGLRWRERDRIGQASKAIQGETTAFTITDFPPQVLTLLRSYQRVTP